jgi:chemotaxis protein histidine kinase CheA
MFQEVTLIPANLSEEVVDQLSGPVDSEEAMAGEKKLSGAAATAAEKRRLREEAAEDEAPLAPAPKKKVKKDEKEVKKPKKAPKAQPVVSLPGSDEEEEEEEEEATPKSGAAEVEDGEEDLTEEDLKIAKALKKAAREAGTEARANSRDSTAQALERIKAEQAKREQEAEEEEAAKRRLKKLKEKSRGSKEAAESDDELPPPPPKKSTKVRASVTLDSEDEAVDLSLMKKRSRAPVSAVERYTSILTTAGFDFKKLTLSVSKDGEKLFLNLRYDDRAPSARLVDWTQVNGPLAISKYSKEGKPTVEVELEVAPELQTFFDHLNVRAWRLIRKMWSEAGQEFAASWSPLCDGEVLKKSRGSEGAVPTVRVKLELFGDRTPLLVLMERDGDEFTVLAQGKGEDFFKEHEALFQNARIKGAFSFPSMYEMEGGAGITKPKFVNTLFIERLPFKKQEVAKPSKTSRADLMAMLGARAA